ncbi:unnamed protein product [Polarella glacialis]|uniref:Granulins domain-containing protein n=1 Tax=Polarella glacialis TaxID=89957 RepID=A0A813FUX8_POLGL|nr:unnamed protein product [Polarella glacialis]CAE8695047.1 unnamed protein product [Polarella glacialis]
MMSTVSTAWIASWLLLHALVGSALAAAEGGSPGACDGAEACVEKASEEDPVVLLQAPVRGAAVAAGADEDWWRRRAGRSVGAAGAVVGSMTGEEPAEASHTQAVQTQDPLTPSVGSVAVGGAANKPCQDLKLLCSSNIACCSGRCVEYACCSGLGEKCTYKGECCGELRCSMKTDWKGKKYTVCDEPDPTRRRRR